MQDWSEFDERIKKISEDFADQEIPRPPFWSGFRVVPKLIEFWEDGEFRIHQREVFEREINGWKVKKIYP